MLRGLLLMARREARLLRRNRAAVFGLLLVVALAWLPPLAIALRQGVVGLASFSDVAPLTLAAIGVVMPLITLLAGTDLLAGELEDGSLVPLLTLGITRPACLLGKYAGRWLVFTAGYGLAFASSTLSIVALQGAEGLGDYVMVVASGLALSSCCLAIGAALGATRGGRVRAFGAALVAWLVLVFAIAAVLLAVLIAGAPAGPQSVGAHGHAELAPLRSVHDPAPSSDPHARHMEETPAEPTASIWWMTLDPVDLFRISAMAGASGLRARLELLRPKADDIGLWAPLLTGWLCWLAAPLLVAVLRIRRMDLV